MQLKIADLYDVMGRAFPGRGSSSDDRASAADPALVDNAEWLAAI